MPMHSAAINAAIAAHFGSDHDTANMLGTHHWALFNGDPTGAGVEPDTSGGYARVAKTNDDTRWTVSGATATQAEDVVYPVTTGLWSETSLTHWALMDAASGGNVWYSGALPSTITITGASEYPTVTGIVITQQA